MGIDLRVRHTVKIAAVPSLWQGNVSQLVVAAGCLHDHRTLVHGLRIHGQNASE
jgi:hypothetical protein